MSPAHVAIGLGSWCLVWACALAGCVVDELEGTEIGCAWFAADNCWRDSLEAAKPCTHDASTPGALSADGARCSFADGTEITFAQPIDLDHMNTYIYDFEIQQADTFCLSYSEATQATSVLETSLGTFRSELKAGGIQIECPAGDLFKVVDAMSLYSCEARETILPGWSDDWAPTGGTFRFRGGDTIDGVVPVFTCQAP